MPRPHTNQDFWNAKFARNQARDQRNHDDLVAAGWTVLVAWECRLKKGRLEATMAEIVDEVTHAGEASGEGRLVEVGAPEGWKLRVARGRITRHRTH